VLRALSALVMVPLAVSSLYVGGALFHGLVLAMACVMALEWSSVTSISQRGPMAPLVFVVALVVAVSVSNMQLSLVLWPIGALFLIFFAQPNRRQVHVMGYAYITIPALALISLRGEPTKGFSLLLILMVVVWCADTFAYLGGRLIGGPKLWPSISPSKTWAGAVAGFAAGLLGGYILCVLGYDVGSCLLVSAILALASIMGDLLESFFKRFYGQKDSSSFIPGHGGLLDRVDGIVVSAPLLWLLVYLEIA